ncbi:MAG: aminoglycoside phosphotransferase [Cyanobacteria bacterium RYN_339]|nr:aminoglycoside phosphotransferase [Cyanobacteria bacterium RYN_339]
MIDEPVAVRDALDEWRLRDYLAEELGSRSDELELRQFPGGYSNLTYAVRWGADQWVLRCPPPGVDIKGAHDVLREAKLLACLAPVLPWAPAPLIACTDRSVIGAPFYLMRHVEGLILRRDPPAGLSLPPVTVRAICDALIQALVDLHALDPARLGLGDFGRPVGYAQRQVDGWTRRLEAARTGDQAELAQVAAWLAAHVPPDGAPALIHNDFKLDNVVLDPADPTRIIGILDWEMAALGDPWMDVGSSLAYWIEAADEPVLLAMRFGPTHLPGAYTRDEWVARYCELSGRAPVDFRFYRAFGLFKVAVVGQQLFKRYADGKSTDKRFAHLDRAVAALAREALAAL